MSKNKFLESLRKKLAILEESEIEDIITEYDGYIEEKIAQGTIEEDAVKSMGDIDELARDLLSAYKIKSPSDKQRDGLNNVVDSFINIFDQIISVFSQKSFNDILKFIIELVCIFIIIAICKIPFEIIASMGRGIFSSFGSHISHVINCIWNVILEFAYLIFAVLLFIKIFESRYLNGNFESIFHNNPKDEDDNKEIKTDEKVEKKISKERKQTKYVKKETHESNNFGIIDTLSKICIFFIKFILVFVLFGVGLFLAGMAITLGIIIYLLVNGVFYFGIYLVLISLLILGIVAFIFLYNFIFEHKNKTGLLLITLLIGFCLLGVGTGISTLEFASTTIIYTDNLEKNKTLEYEFEMQDNLVLSSNIFYDEDIIVDNSLDNKIKVVYSYDDKYLKIDANPYISNDYDKFMILNLGYVINEFKYSKEILDNFINRHLAKLNI